MGELYKQCLKGPHGLYSVHNGYLYRGNCLCIPKCCIRKLLEREVHDDALSGHFGMQKTLLYCRIIIIGHGC